jgi:coenzyme PQQ precursor peptide PqqA
VSHRAGAGDRRDVPGVHTFPQSGAGKRGRAGVFHETSFPQPVSAQLLRYLRAGQVSCSVSFCTIERRQTMKWSKPQYQDLRFGFEITMYISAR